MERFKVGDIVVHFKRELNLNEPITNFDKMYKIIGEGFHTEDEEMCVIYQALYGDKKIFIRPTKMFESEIDKEKYPNVKTKYRLTKVEIPITKKELYSSLKGNWIAYIGKDGNIKHCRIESYGENSLVGKKKNGCKDIVSYDKILGLCNKPTKTNKNPQITIPSNNVKLEKKEI